MIVSVTSQQSKSDMPLFMQLKRRNPFIRVFLIEDMVKIWGKRTFSLTFILLLTSGEKCKNFDLT